MSIKYEYVLAVDSIAELKTIDGVKTKQLAIVKTNAGDQALYYFDIASTATNDDDLVVAVTDQTNGRWIRFLPSFEKVNGALGTAPLSGTVAVSHQSIGGMIRSTFVLTAAQIAVSDDGANGSFGTLNLFTFPEGAISHLGSRQDYTAFAEGSALTGGAGDAVFEIGLGTVAISTEDDGTLVGTQDDIGGDVNVTLSGGTGVGSAVTGSGVVHNGTATAATLNLNWTGTAATIDANSTIDVTGTITVLWAMMGDD